MTTTYTTDIPDWIPAAIDAAFYDTVGTPERALLAHAFKFNELEGRPGQSIRIPTALATTPAENLAESVPATDDKLQSGSITLSVKEGVKSIAWSDRSQVQASQDVNRIAGQRVGNAMLDRIELDLGAAALAGRNTGADTATAAGGKLTAAAIKAAAFKIPRRLRKLGLDLFADDQTILSLFDDATLSDRQKNPELSEEMMRSGQATLPIYGVTPYVVDDGVIPKLTVGTARPTALIIARGMLGYGFQKNPTTEQERDARARLTRIVGTMIHGEGTMESAGIVAITVTA